jgi:hypothetical protein
VVGELELLLSDNKLKQVLKTCRKKLWKWLADISAIA